MSISVFDFDGTLLLVSHDRDFLDNVVTATIALDGKGGVEEYAGGCEDWLDQMTRPKEKAKPAPKPREKKETEAPKKRKLLNKEREALNELPKQIERMEADRDQIPHRCRNLITIEMLRTTPLATSKNSRNWRTKSSRPMKLGKSSRNYLRYNQLFIK